MEKLDGKTMDVIQTNIEKLKQLFPEVFTEEKIDFEKLQLTLGEHVETEKERYQFTWNGKTEAIQMAQKQSTGTLRPCKEESVDWDTTQNLYIEGDNLEVLRLLQNSYRNKVKMIYIDPPYNTGRDFVYKDNFRDNVKNYKEKMDESYKSNPETNGRYHTDWLNMMYPRLKLAKSILKDDGVIFISIDENEESNLSKICDEIFGEHNFIVSIIWQSKVSPSNDAKYFSSDHEYILCYAKNKENFKLRRLERTDKQKDYYKNPDSDNRGPWNSVAYTCNKSKEERPNLFYSISNPNTGERIYPKETAVWAFSKEQTEKFIKEKRFYWGKDGTSKSPRYKKFLSEAGNVVPRSIQFYNDVGHTQEATKELSEIIPASGFLYPKPTRLIKRLIELSVEPNEEAIILDFFAGSGSTAHALLNMNNEDNGSRKFIMVQIPEVIEVKSTTYKAGYKNICEIGKERIRRAGQKIKEENKGKEGIKDLDIGFKVFKMDETNLKIWDEEAEDIEDNLLFFEGAVKEGRSKEDVLYEILLKYGLDLTVPIEEEKVGDITAFSVGMGYLVVCLDKNLSTKDIEQLVSNYPDCERMVFLDNGFATDEVKINAEQILKRNGVQDIRVI